MRDVLNRHIGRGRLTGRVSLHSGAGAAAARVHVNVPLAKAYAKELNRLAKELKLTGTATLEQVAGAPGVIQTDDELVDGDFWPAVEKALTKAVSGLLTMRKREGAHLEADLARRVKELQKSVASIQKQAPQVTARFRAQLLERIKAAGLESPALDDERLIREVVYFADRSDISEELTRLESHFKQFEDCRKASEPVGRTLDFLAQEMNREINTIGSKANDSLISRDIVNLKAELEKFREQAQNVE
jgi:uncharacterized protein (TIGR00255 family)